MKADKNHEEDIGGCGRSNNRPGDWGERRYNRSIKALTCEVEPCSSSMRTSFSNLSSSRLMINSGGCHSSSVGSRAGRSGIGEGGAGCPNLARRLEAAPYCKPIALIIDSAEAIVGFIQHSVRNCNVSITYRFVGSGMATTRCMVPLVSTLSTGITQNSIAFDSGI